MIVSGDSAAKIVIYEETQIMKALIIAGVFAATSSIAAAGSSDFLSHIGGPEYDHNYGTHGMAFAPVQKTDSVASLNRLIVESNVDGIALNDFRGTIDTWGPSRISLYEVVRNSPEGLSYFDYHQRFAADTDWDQVASEYRANKLEGNITAGVQN